MHRVVAVAVSLARAIQFDNQCKEVGVPKSLRPTSQSIHLEAFDIQLDQPARLAGNHIVLATYGHFNGGTDPSFRNDGVQTTAVRGHRQRLVDIADTDLHPTRQILDPVGSDVAE